MSNTRIYELTEMTLLDQYDSDVRTLGEGVTPYSAVLASGIRCGTCNHWDKESGGICEKLTHEFTKWPGDIVTPERFFCSEHPRLNRKNENDES